MVFGRFHAEGVVGLSAISFALQKDAAAIPNAGFSLTVTAPGLE